MALHILKLCVGCDSIADLEGWIEETMAMWRRLGKPEEQFHTTRMVPKRLDEILAGGSLYWVIRGMILCRQPIADLEAVTGADGIERCRIVFKPKIIPVRPAPRRAFQGWRYLEEADAPPDLPKTARAEWPNPLTCRYRCADGRWVALCMPGPRDYWDSFCVAEVSSICGKSCPGN